MLIIYWMFRKPRVQIYFILEFLKKERNCYPFIKCIIHKSLNNSIFPESWKVANVTPVFKKGDKSSVSNYRPTSLLSIIGKLMERCVFKYFMYTIFLRCKFFFTKHQSDFTPGDSAINQLLDITNDIRRR